MNNLTVLIAVNPGVKLAEKKLMMSMSTLPSLESRLKSVSKVFTASRSLVSQSYTIMYTRVYDRVYKSGKVACPSLYTNGQELQYRSDARYKANAF